VLFEHKSRQKYLEAIQRHGLLRYNSFERRETLAVLLFVYITGEKFSREIEKGELRSSQWGMLPKSLTGIIL
jgi:hypothetical protein